MICAVVPSTFNAAVVCVVLSCVWQRCVVLCCVVMSCCDVGLWTDVWKTSHCRQKSTTREERSEREREREAQASVVSASCWWALLCACVSECGVIDWQCCV